MERAELQPFQLSELLSMDVPERFRRQVVDYGFFYLQVHGIADSLHEGAKGAAMSLFIDGSIETKQLLKPARKDVRRGYSDLEAESTAFVTNSGSFSDYSMCFSMGSNENVFPSKAFETAWTSYYAALKVLSEHVARAVMAGAAGLRDDAVDALFPCEPLLRLRYFPEVPDHRTADRIPMRMASHYDLSIVTLVQQTPVRKRFREPPRPRRRRHRRPAPAAGHGPGAVRGRRDDREQRPPACPEALRRLTASGPADRKRSHVQRVFSEAECGTSVSPCGRLEAMGWTSP